MAGMERAIHEIHHVENLAERDNLLCRIHPLSKVLVTFWYLILVMSFPKYNITGLLQMCLYPVLLFEMGELSAGRALKRLRPLLLAVCLLGAANPLFDRAPYGQIGGFLITTGMVSALTLIVKAGLAVFASYLLIATTTIEEICYALRKLHLPQILVTLLLLIYRYLVLMLKEASRITQAYSLRAPRQRGIHYKAWGSLAGQMLLRSMDRAEAVYESMTLRGFHGEFYLQDRDMPRWKSVVYAVLWFGILAVLRWVPVFEIIGRLL